MKITLITSLFLAIIVTTLVFDKQMSVNTIDNHLTRLTLKPGSNHLTETQSIASVPVIFLSSPNAEALRVQYSRTGFPGPKYLELILTDGGVTVWQNTKSDHLRKKNRQCRAVDIGLRCRVPLVETKNDSSFVLVTPIGDQASIEQITVISVAQHQPLLPTNFSVVLIIFSFVPLALLIGTIKSTTTREILIFGSSLLFIALLSVGLLLFLLVFLTISYGLLLRLTNHSSSIAVYITILVMSVLTVKLIWPITGIHFNVPINWFILPIGLSYLIARQIDLAFKVRTRQTQLPTFFNFLTYNLFWPSFAAGPITQITSIDFKARTSDTWAGRESGLTRMGIGLLKKTLADLVFSYIVIRQFPNVMIYETAEPLSLMTFFWGNMLFVYLDFSGYTDMVLGAARLMGISLPENFNNPLMRPNMRTFWQNWHISLTQWVNRTVFMPFSLSIRREHKIVTYVIPIIATTLTIAIWHGFQFVWILWALHHAAGIFLTDLFIRIGKILRERNEWFGMQIAALSNRLGFLFVWFWLMLSYCFTLSTNPIIAIKNYEKLVTAPFNILIKLL